MTQQPEALRLAAALDALLGYRGINADVGKAAAELRRLEAEVERKAAGIKFLWQECDNQERINAQLLEALELAVLQSEHDMLMTGEELRICRAAIKAAKGEA
jgi:hypothetical protein